MQKNKKILYVLVPVTLLVWGIIIYKLLNVVKTGNDELTAKRTRYEIGSKNELLADTFTICANYRDPFLGKISSNESPKIAATLIKAKETTAPTPWPLITYMGIIKNQRSNKQFVIIQINDQNITMKPGEINNGVELLKVFKDSVEVKFNKEKRFIKKSM